MACGPIRTGSPSCGGAWPGPTALNEAVMTQLSVQEGGMRVGQVLPVGYYTAAQLASKGFGTPRVAPALKVDVRLVGIVTLNRQVIEDDVDRTSGFLIFTPAFSPGHERGVARRPDHVGSRRAHPLRAAARPRQPGRTGGGRGHRQRQPARVRLSCSTPPRGSLPR